MRTRTKVLIGSGIVLGMIGSAVGIGWAGAGDDGGETPLAGDALDRAVAAALAHTGGGSVIETETGDDGAAYGVEIRGADGSVIEVRVDANFEVIGSENDDDSGPEGDDGA